MRFGVLGADKESGNDVEVVLTAANLTEAEAEACKRNILVSAIKPIADDDKDAIALVDDDDGGGDLRNSSVSRAGMSVSAAQAQASGRSSHGTITVNANSPSGSARTGEGAAPGEAKGEAAMEYHILMNQSLYLLETAVNKQLRDGWEPQGGLMVAFTNNQTQFYQAVIWRKAARQRKSEVRSEKSEAVADYSLLTSDF